MDQTEEPSQIDVVAAAKAANIDRADIAKQIGTWEMEGQPVVRRSCRIKLIHSRQGVSGLKLLKFAP